MLVPSFFTEEELRPVIAAVNECVDILANKLFNGGKIKVREFVEAFKTDNF